ncbi:MAG: calcium-binding protein, partial [Gammaproteobacteria bacterium]|nr:calcium-binding protein [Gammaproteobacteria bacterium]
RLFGGDGTDTLDGGLGDDVLFGGTGDDRLEGNRGNDYLMGNFGDDVLFGGEGDDYLNGLVGDDALYGGDGSDTYDFGYPNVTEGALPGFGRETVRDSGGANDRVTFGRRRHEDLWLTRDGDDLRISVLGGADDEVLIEDQFAAGGAHRIEHLSAATRLLSYGRYNEQSVSIDALVNAMVQFDKPQAGWSRMTAQERADVHAAWRSVGIAPTVG